MVNIFGNVNQNNTISIANNLLFPELEMFVQYHKPWYVGTLLTTDTYTDRQAMDRTQELQSTLILSITTAAHALGPCSR